MLFLFNSGARIGYVENVLNTLSLPFGAENVYQYSINSGSYVDPEIRQGTIHANEFSDKEVLIVFVNKEKDTYQYIPLRKAEFLKRQDIDGRAYFTVIMREYCFSKDALEVFNNDFANLFVAKCFNKKDSSINKTDTKACKINAGYLAFTGADISQSLTYSENNWYKTVMVLKEISIFKEANAVFTKISIKKGDAKLVPRKISEPGKPSFNLQQGKEYNAELSYLMPFHDDETGSYIEVIMVSIPDNTTLSGSSKVQKFNVMQSVVNYRFFATKPVKSGEIIFKINNIYSKNDIDIKMAWRGINFKVNRSLKRWLLIVLLIIGAGGSFIGMNYFSTCINKAVSIDKLSCWKYIGAGIFAVLSSVTLWLASVLFGKKDL